MNSATPQPDRSALLNQLAERSQLPAYAVLPQPPAASLEQARRRYIEFHRRFGLPEPIPLAWEQIEMFSRDSDPRERLREITMRQGCHTEPVALMDVEGVPFLIV
jgi:hypothetical protein